MASSDVLFLSALLSTSAERLKRLTPTIYCRVQTNLGFVRPVSDSPWAGSRATMASTLQLSPYSRMARR
jgi:hypothetical protein